MASQTAGSRFSLKFKLILMTASVITILSGSSFFVFNCMIETQKQSLQDSFQSQATALGDAIGAQYFERYGDIQDFALNPNLLSPDKRVIADTLNAYSALYLIYDLIMIVDRNGNLVSVTDKDPTGKDLNVTDLYKKNFSNEPWFKDTLEGKFTNDSAKGFVGTYSETVQNDKWVGMVYGGNRLGTSFSAQMKDKNGKVIGVITNRAGARWFEVAFKEVYLGLKAQHLPDSELALTAADGTLLYSYNPDPASEKLADSIYDWNKLLKTTRFEKDGVLYNRTTQETIGSGIENDTTIQQKVVYGFSKVQSAKFTESLGWMAVVMDRTTEAMVTIETTRKLFMLVFAIALAIGIIIAYLFANNLSNILSKVSNTLTLRPSQVASSSEEIAKSSSALSDLTTEQAAAIQETAASIDEMVHDLLEIIYGKSTSESGNNGTQHQTKKANPTTNQNNSSLKTKDPFTPISQASKAKSGAIYGSAHTKSISGEVKLPSKDGPLFEEF